MPIAVPKKRRPTTPGEIIREEFLIPLGMSQAELARQMGGPGNRISQLLSGKRALTAETALRLEAVLGVDATTWMNLQAACDLWEARQAGPARGLQRHPARAGPRGRSGSIPWPWDPGTGPHHRRQTCDQHGN